jgi:hypothetical protein
MSPQFELQVDREQYSPGETISGTLLVHEGGGSRSLEVLLTYKEKTQDYSAVVSSVSSGPLHTGDLTPGMSFGFALPLPPDALPNLKSEHGELCWQLDAKSDEHGLDTHELRRIEVIR